MTTLRSLVQTERARFGAALAALSLGVALAYVPAFVTGAAIDGLSGGGEPSPFTRFALAFPGLSERLAGTLWRAAIAIAVFTAASGLFLYLQGRWAAEASERLALALRERLYDHIQHLPASYHARVDVGDLVQRCSSDVETVRTFLATQVVQIGRSILLVGMALPVMLAMHPAMTLWALLLFPPILALAVIYFGRIRTQFLAVDEAEGEMTSVLQENLSGIRVVRAFSQQEHECRRFARTNAAFRDHSETLMAMLARYWASSDLLCMGQVGLVLIAGGALIRSGEITVGTLFTFMSWVNLLVWPVRHAGRVLSESGKATVSLRRIREVLLEPVEGEWPEHDASSKAANQLRRGELSVENLCFAHDGAAPVLQDLSFSAAPGETIALVGPPGCGKSTILSLLLRLHDADSGCIRIDGTDIRALPRKEARKLVAAVLQEPFLFSRSVADNIRLAVPEAGEADVERVARAACMHESIGRFAEGYETLVGERGVTLSGGQRQRVAIARALLEDAPVLVLDDALSAVDTETEAAISEALVRLHGRRTMLVAAHRLSTVREADRILVLERGRVVQSGRHEELLAQEGAYRRLWAVQSVQGEELMRDLRAVRSEGTGGAA